MAATVIERTSVDEVGLHLRVRTESIGGTTSIHEGVMAPGELVPPHTHANEDQCLFVAGGSVVVLIGEDVVHAGTGDLVVKPRGLPHAIWNPGPAVARVLEITSPGGFEAFYDAMAAVQGPEEAASVGARFGMTFHHERIEEVRERLTTAYASWGRPSREPNQPST